MRILIHMIRHGLTEGNANDWIYGGIDIPITEEGKQKILHLKEKGIYPDPDTKLYYTSGMLRAKQTFELIYGDKPTVDIPALAEMRFGSYEKTSYWDAIKIPEFKAFFEDKTGDLSVGGGESRNHFINRVVSGMNELVKKVEEGSRDPGNGLNGNGETEAVCVCHGGVISVAISERFKKKDVEHIYGWTPKPGRGYTLVYEDSELVDFTPIE
jgi:alpha-ribazole phosphatase